MTSFFEALAAFVGLIPPPAGATPRNRRRNLRPPARTTASVVPSPPVVPQPLPRIDTRALAVPLALPAATAVRILLVEAGRGASLVGLGGRGKTDADARSTLGQELAAYVDLCIAEANPLPSQNLARERADDPSYRARLRRACLADLDLWERAQRRRDRERAEAAEAGLRQPEPMYVPAPVAQAIAERAAARLAERTARGGRGGQGSGAKPGQAEASAQAPSPPAGPKR